MRPAPKASPVAASATAPTTVFSPFARTAVESAPIAATCSRPPSLFVARVSPRFLDVSPCAHARYGDVKGGSRRQSERNPSAHPPGLSAAVYSLRVLPEGAPAVGASAADGWDFIHVDVCHRILFMGGNSRPGCMPRPTVSGFPAFFDHRFWDGR